jgi:hypothetical protein
MLILSADDCERLILALLTEQPFSEADRRALILELVAARRRALDAYDARDGHDPVAGPASDDPPPRGPPSRRWAFVKEHAAWVGEIGDLLGPGIARGTILARKR